jgi:hypothetical protein
MSATGSYAVVRRHEWPRCIALAQTIRTETTGRWIFKQSRVVGMDEFANAWQAAVVREVDFEHSGYALGTCLDAHEAILGRALVGEQSEAVTALAKVFTAGFPFERAVPVPDLPSDRLDAFCRQEYGDDEPPETAAALADANRFLQRGMAEISPDHIVVFIIK